MTGRHTCGRIVRSSLKGNRMFSSPTRSNAGKTGHRLVVTGVVAALTLGMAACGGGGSGAPAAAKAPDASALSKAGGVTKVTFWHAMDGTNAEVLTKLVDAFNKANAGKIKVEATYVGKYDDAIAKYKASIQSKSTPDVVQVYDIGTRFMIDAGQAVPMQDFIDRDKVDMSDLQPNIAGYYSVDKKLYSMPFNTSMPVLYINEKLFKEAGLDPTKPPTTLAEIRTAAREAVQEERRAGRLRVRRRHLRLAARAVHRPERRGVLRPGQRPGRQGDQGQLRRRRPASRSSPGGRRWSRTAWPPTPAATRRRPRPPSSPASWR